MTTQDKNTNSSCTETEFIEELLASDGLPWKNSQAQSKGQTAKNSFKEYLGTEQEQAQDATPAEGEYDICQVLDDVIDIVKLMSTCVEETNHSKYEVDRLIKEKAQLEAEAKRITSDKSNVKQVQQNFANEVLLPHLTQLDELLDVAEPKFAGDSVLEAHVQGIRILERAFSNNLVSAGLLTEKTVEQTEAKDEQQAQEELAQEDK